MPGARETESFNVLIVEDHDKDYEALVKLLETTGPRGEKVHASRARNVSAAIATARAQKPDVILMDLFLGDENGLTAVEKIAESGSEIPIVIVTNADSDALAIEALEMGAQDYLHKDQLNSTTLYRAIQYARMRSQYLRQRQAKEEQAAEYLTWLHEHASRSQSRVTAQMMGERALEQGDPEALAIAVERFNEIMDHSFEQRRLRVDHGVKLKVLSLAEYLGRLNASHTDVVAVMRDAVDKMIANSPPERGDWIMNEARHRGFQLMGFLAMHYRDHALGGRIQRGSGAE